MGRSAERIKDFIIAKVGQKASLSVMSSNTNPDALWKQFVECVANVLETHETQADAHRDRVEAVLNFANPHTHLWIAQKASEFQYDAETPQILTTVDGVIQYETIDVSKRIITNCVVRTTSSRIATISVAKGDPFEKLTALELSAFDAYMNSILQTSFNLCGVLYTCVSLDPDYCFIEATVKYAGLYSTTIEANVTTAIENYLQNLGIYGRITPYGLIEAVQAVPGVSDFIIKNLARRANATAFAAKTYLINTFVDQTIIYSEATAGYAYTEVETGEELSTKLTFTAI